MEMMQFLEADKEQLMRGLVSAGTPEQAQGVLEKEFDKLLFRYNEECTEERVRDTARYMLQAAKMMIPMLSATGDVKIWSKSSGGTSSEGGFKLTVPAIICLVGGCVFLVGAILGLAVSAGNGVSMSALLGAIPAAILAGAFLFFAGRLSTEKKKGQEGGGQQVEIKADAEKIWSCVRAVVLSVDKSLKETGDVVSYEKSQLSASVGNGIAPEEADLFSGILESAYCQREENQDDTSMQEMISMVRYYLHRKQVETVDYGGGKREWFELLPGKQDMTLRPALVRDGMLIRKGLAVTAQ